MINFPTEPKINLNELYLWADMVKLACMVNADRTCSRKSFLDRFFPTTKDFDTSAIENNHIDEDDIKFDNLSVRSHDGREHFSMEVLKVCRSREMNYDTLYPFNVTNGPNYVIKLNENHKRLRNYVYLLVASHTGRITDKNERSKLTSDFEALSREVLLKYLGNKATVHLVGANNATIKNYTKLNKASKLKTLAEMANARFIGTDNDPALLTKSGDAGLDLFGYLPTPDNLPGSLVVFGQCKCSSEWYKHIHEGTYQQLGSLLSFKSAPVATYFIPVSFRSSENNWFSDSKINAVILFDRFRILSLLDVSYSPQIKKSRNFLKKIIEYTEPLV